MSTLTLDDMPKHSVWPARLLGLEPWEPRRKSVDEVVREYEGEKWGPLLQKVREIGRPVSCAEVDEWSVGSLPAMFCSAGDTFELLPPMTALDRHVDMAESAIRPYLPASALVELGAGYGSVILALARRAPLSGTPMMAGEFTDSGTALIATLAAAQGSAVAAGRCDFRSPQITPMAIPPGAVIFTSHAVPYVPWLEMTFVDALSSFRPKAVIHLEPCYEHCDPRTLLGLMRRRYIEVNGYNRNLATLLHIAEDAGTINILEERPALFGTNALLPASLLVWSPVN
jgi:hypothetical protein